MTDLYKRTWFRAAALSVVAAALIVGCGKKEEPKPAPVVEAPKPEPLKIAFAYVGPVGDGGWTFAHDNARKALEAEFGDKIKTESVERASIWTDTNIYNELGIPAVKIGPRGRRSGRMEEIDIDVMVRAAQIYALMALDICSRSRG